jgi:hypothetical protein
MSSGAYAYPIDQSAGGGSNGPIQRVIPLPPTQHQGAINFNNGWLSLAYEDFGGGPAEIDVRVRILSRTVPGGGAGTPRLDQTMRFPVGRSVVSELQSGDLAASFQYPPGGGQIPAGGARPVLAALVEYDD